MKKNTNNTVNLFFSAFLVIAYTVCCYFFLQYADSLANTNPTLSSIIVAAVSVVFGLLLFYATRVGEGKTIFRFSPFTLVLLVLPSLYMVLTTIITTLPLSQFMTGDSNITAVLGFLCATLLGYSIPYTFVSGFETVEETVIEEVVLEGGIEEELLDGDYEEVNEEEIDEIVVEGVAAEENASVETETQEEITE